MLDDEMLLSELGEYVFTLLRPTRLVKSKEDNNVTLTVWSAPNNRPHSDVEINYWAETLPPPHMQCDPDQEDGNTLG